MRQLNGKDYTGSLREIVTEYSLALDQLHNDGALMVKNPETWWTARRQLDNWLLDRLQFGYVAKTAKQLADTRNSIARNRRNRVPSNSE